MVAFLLFVLRIEIGKLEHFFLHILFYYVYVHHGRVQIRMPHNLLEVIDLTARA